MKHLKYLLAFSLAAAPSATALEAPAAAPKAAEPAANLPKPTLWASELEDPQAIIRAADGSILVSEYKGGRVVRFDASGQKKTVVAQGLRGPTMMARLDNAILIAERKANRVVRLAANGTITPMGGEIEEPLGLSTGSGAPVVISHTTSKVLRWVDGAWRPLFEPAEADRYGYRCLAAEPSGAMLMTDEDSGQVLLLSPGGRVATWAKGFSSPSGIEIGPDGAVYVADEKDGTISKVSAEGQPTVVASGLGKPRGMLFVDAKTMLVADRAGNIWRVSLG